MAASELGVTPGEVCRMCLTADEPQACLELRVPRNRCGTGVGGLQKGAWGPVGSEQGRCSFVEKVVRPQLSWDDRLYTLPLNTVPLVSALWAAFQEASAT